MGGSLSGISTGYEAVFDAIPLPSLLLNRDLNIIGVNAAYLVATMRKRDGMIGLPLFEAFPDNPNDLAADGVSNLRTSLMEVLRTREPQKMAVQKYDIQKSGSHEFEVRYWDPVNVPVLDAQGEIACIIHTVQDVTQNNRASQAQAYAEDQRALLIRELEHRIKNTLTMVQAIVDQSFRNTASPKDTIHTINQRLIALGGAHDLLTAQNWRSAALRDVVERAVGGHQETVPRIGINGPDVSVGARSSFSLAMALHELCTNATKYGALSNHTGTVELSWTVDHAQSPPRFYLEWRERGGPAYAPPTRKGFGSRLVAASFGSEVEGHSRLEFDPAGVIWRIDLPLHAMGQ
ncbi:MAG TPA: HWE histidine kinase domain-containing protein [Rhizomicrobium sp.]